MPKSMYGDKKKSAKPRPKPKTDLKSLTQRLKGLNERSKRKSKRK